MLKQSGIQKLVRAKENVRIEYEMHKKQSNAASVSRLDQYCRDLKRTLNEYHEPSKHVLKHLKDKKSPPTQPTRIQESIQITTESQKEKESSGKLATAIKWIGGICITAAVTTLGWLGIEWGIDKLEGSSSTTTLPIVIITIDTNTLVSYISYCLSTSIRLIYSSIPAPKANSRR